MVSRTSSRHLLLLLWMLEIATHAIVGTSCICQEDVPQVLGLLGSSVELNCVYPKKETYSLDKLLVYWQTENGDVVHTYISGKDNTYQNHSYQNRTQLSRARLLQWDVSLLLSNLTLADSKLYKCIVISREQVSECVHQTCAFLKVAARFTTPCLTKIETSTFLSCLSSNGYPEPKMYWINNDDGQVLDPSLSETVHEIDPDTQLYSVRSRLKINSTSARNISCLVENAVLMENQTSPPYIWVVDDPVDSRQISNAEKATAGVLSIVFIVILVLGFTWVCKKSICAAYRGVAQAEIEMPEQSLDQRSSPDVNDPLTSSDDALH
ncbi:ICOS ligand-like isoform X2 [Ambystoma mexicanum]|uniref:ICOS ligand-like isoform X2 n=1 Tax=Ambystoma mexicanum TaxID=8296 RepID=UPI0037E7F0EB